MEIEPFEELAKYEKINTTPKEGIMREEIAKQKTQEQAKTSSITLKSDEYERIAKALIYQVKTEEKHNDNGIKQSALIEWFISQNISLVNNMEEYNQFTRILRSIINRLLKNERVFMISQDDAEP